LGIWTILVIIGIVSILMISIPDLALAAKGQITEINPSGHGVIREDDCDDADEDCEYNFQFPDDLDDKDYAPQLNDRVTFTPGAEQTATGISAASDPAGVPGDDPASDAKAIPDWIDNLMGFYLNNLISENELLEAFNWLFDNNIMHLSQEAAQRVQDLRDENELLRIQLDVSSAAQVGKVEVRGWDVTQKEEINPEEKACMIYHMKGDEVDAAIVAVDLRDYDFELPEGALTELKYCVQYKETDFDFVMRLMEEEGIYYFMREESDISEPIPSEGDMVSASIQDLCFFKTEAEVEAEFDKLDANDTEGLAHDEWDFVQVFEDVAGQEPPNDIVTKKELVAWWKAKCIPP
jgi:hypothetical protein